MVSVQLNGHAPAVITLFLNDQSSWLQEVSARLSAADYESSMARTVSDAWSLLASRPDALLADGACKDSLRLYHAICEQIAPDDRPLLALVSDAPLDSAGLPPDVIPLPSSFYHLEHQLRAFLRLRQANRALRQTNAALLDDNRRLKDETSVQRRLADEMNLLKNAIVRNVSHELKTPLLQVKTAVALLAEDDGKTAILLDMAMNATARLEGAVRNVTLLNELLNEGLEVQAHLPVLVGDALQYALRNLRRSWEHKGQIERIRADLSPNLPPALADRQGLGIALQLLIDNALKFSHETVEVTARLENDQVVIAVKDYGIGIAADNREKIFDSFYQIDNSTTRRYGGMGIGLAVVRFILDRHQTQIIVESEEGKGSTFRFALPAAKLA